MLLKTHCNFFIFRHHLYPFLTILLVAFFKKKKPEKGNKEETFFIKDRAHHHEIASRQVKRCFFILVFFHTLILILWRLAFILTWNIAASKERKKMNKRQNLNIFFFSLLCEFFLNYDRSWRLCAPFSHPWLPQLWLKNDIFVYTNES